LLGEGLHNFIGGLAIAGTFVIDIRLGVTAFLVGGLLTCALSATVDVAYLIPFAAGNFVYIAAADLVPEVNRRPRAAVNAVNTVVSC
jgi:zinc and cadmium transporter